MLLRHLALDFEDDAGVAAVVGVDLDAGRLGGDSVATTDGQDDQ